MKKPMFKINLQLFAEPEVKIEKEVIIEKPVIEVDKIISKETELRLQIEKEVRDKIALEESEKLKKIEDEKTKADFEKLKTALEDTNKEIDGTKEFTKEQFLDLSKKYSETTEMMKVYVKTIEKIEEEKNLEKFKNEVGKKVQGNELLEKLVSDYIATGLIKNMDDYNRVVAPQESIYKKLKEQEDLIKSYGNKNPRGDHSGEKREVSSGKKLNIDDDKLKKMQQDINKKFGIISR